MIHKFDLQYFKFASFIIAKKKSIAEENKLRDQNYYEHPGTELLIPNHWKTTKATETTCFLVVPLVLD